MRVRQTERGFTLVELSVVVVIIGLLIGGVLLGRHLIRGAEINSILVDSRNYITAMQQFKNKYQYLPGDFPRAESFWGTDPDGCCCPPSGNLTRKVTTCNGNGDGQISLATLPTEYLRVWQHLADAGMIKGLYSGQSSGSSPFYYPDINAPGGRVTGSGWSIYYYGPISGGAGPWVDGNYGNVLNVYNFGAWATGGGFLTAAEAQGLDQKADDGIPSSGKILSYGTPGGGRCANNATATATYNVATAGLICGMSFVTGF